MPSARLWLRGAKRAALESPPQEQIERLVAVLVEASGEIHRTQERVHSQKYAGVLLGVAEARIAAPLPHVARLEGQAQVGRHVQVPGPTAADLPVVQHAGNAEVRPGERICPESREIEEAPERERSEEHTSELQSPCNLVCRLLLEKKKNRTCSAFKMSSPHRVSER